MNREGQSASQSQVRALCCAQSAGPLAKTCKRLPHSSSITSRLQYYFWINPAALRPITPVQLPASLLPTLPFRQ